MAEQPTCGKGLAENALLPRAMGRVAFALAGVLECHTKALDVKDPAGRKEYDAYRRLIDEFRGLAPQLRTVAEQMAGYRDLPMARHDPGAMASPDAREALQAFVDVEQELLAVLQKQVDEYRGLLDSFRNESSG
jgi:hypothetical protein